jgi:hypothetical protein
MLRGPWTRRLSAVQAYRELATTASYPDGWAKRAEKELKVRLARLRCIPHDLVLHAKAVH